MEFASSIFGWDNMKVTHLWPNFFKNNNKKILVIEDDDEMGSVIKKSLRSKISFLIPLRDHNFDFEYKSDPEDALRCFLQDDMDLIILDWNFRAMNANEVMKLFDEQIEKNLTADRLVRKTPVVILAPNNFNEQDLDLKYFYLYKTIPRNSSAAKIVNLLNSTVHSALTH